MHDYLDSTDGAVQMAFVPPYSPDLNPVEYLWAWLKRHALANFCPHSLTELKTTARNRLRSAQQRASPTFASLVLFRGGTESECRVDTRFRLILWLGDAT